MSNLPVNQDLAKVKLISDNAIRFTEGKYNPKTDKFALQPRLQPLIDSIRNPKLNTPYAVMVTGGWGTGKTSSMKWLSSYLSTGTHKAKDQCTVDTCWFYPWKYQKEDDVWKGLIAEVIVASMNRQTVTTEKVITAAKQFLPFLGSSFVRLLGGTTFKYGEAKTTGEVSYTLKDSFAGIAEAFERHYTPQDAYYNQFEKVLDDWIQGIYSEKRRMVVFIDDLDRCLPDVALKVLEAIKLYLNIEHLVFVVGVDKTVINAVVAKRYEDMVGETRSQEATMVEKARQYLDKMFQVEVAIPPHDQHVRRFLDEQLKECGLLEAIDPDYKETVRDAIDQMASNNPRSVLRAVNSAIMGFQQDNGNPLSRTQRVQHELIKAICSSLPVGDKYKRCHEMLTIKPDRDFFRRWYETVKNLDYRSLEPKEADALERKDPADTKDIETTPTKPTKPELVELFNDETYADYRHYLAVRPLGILMRIPFVDFLEDTPELPVPATQNDLEWLREILAKQRGVGISEITAEKLQQVEKLNLSDSDITHPQLDSLRELQQLTELHLRFTQVTDAGCASLRELQQLRKLELSFNRITDAGCASLKDLQQLTKLDLGGNEITDAGCGFLKDLTQLNELYLSVNQITDAGCASLKELKQLTVLDLGDNQIKDAGCEYLQELKQLTVLTLSNNQIMDAGCASLKELKQLNYLDLRENQISPKMQAELKKAHPNAYIRF